MCNDFYQEENLVTPCGEIPTVPPPPDVDDCTSDSGNTCTSNCSSNCTSNNQSCTSYKAPVEPDPNWGYGGFSLDRP